jgi:hypothetical protein
MRDPQSRGHIDEGTDYTRVTTEERYESGRTAIIRRYNCEFTAPSMPNVACSSAYYSYPGFKSRSGERLT